MRYSLAIAVTFFVFSIGNSRLMGDGIGIGDGITDDTVAIQRAVDDASGDIRLGSGTFRITKPIVVNLEKVGRTSFSGGGVARIVMDGPGPAIRIVGTHDEDVSPTDVSDSVWNRQNGPMIEGIEIVGKHPQAIGIEADGTVQLTITRLIVRNCDHAIQMVRRNGNVSISQCHLFQNAGVGCLIDQSAAQQITIANCHIHHNASGGIVVKKSSVQRLRIVACDAGHNMGGAYASPTPNVLLDGADGSVTSVIIANNHFANAHFNLELRQCRGVSVTGNEFLSGRIKDAIVEACENVVFTSNRFEATRNGMSGVSIVDSRGLTISSNQFTGVVDGDAALVLRRCQRANVTGCTILDYGRCGILCEDVLRSRLSDNLILSDLPDSDGAPVIMKGRNDVVMNDNTAERVTEK
ncbi:Pectate lyase superfamily protein [Rubripirellula tenax]|uniref:Pectate lyase superfamily protein n=1 Tax=Rubripirellula tenax TaxID=2528015 RepID=A0A5C6EIL7_9BACT|nr:right-handed parallel beta-helix repeat-containing protein [Rubripirellula tenax]TWU48902.1 Pectate lyase superfamily protein [Rubripirellula tenax]